MSGRKPPQRLDILPGLAGSASYSAATFQRVIGKPVTEATPAEQAQFVAWEMKNPEAAGMTVAQRDAILNAKTPAEAAALIDKHYERSSGRDRNVRMAAADKPDHRHSGCDAGCDADGRVFHHNALARTHMQLAGGMQEQVRRRLSLTDVAR